ncbi:MAG: TonB family protein [Pyrinomonadaceae bacterium]
MFHNLIESSSHAREFKRRGSFVLFTTSTYALLFIVAGVISIYAYDARLEEPVSEVMIVNPVDLEAPQSEPVRRASAQPSGGNHGGAFVRKDPTAPVDEPRLAPKTISAIPNKNPDLPRGVIVVKDTYDANPGDFGPGTSNDGGSGSRSRGALRVDVETPPPALVEKPKATVLRKEVINGEALALPKPPYPPIAKQLGIEGSVNVQVLVDETGKVISAKAVSGDPALTRAAQQAALNARFSPTKIGEQAVKVSGVIIYNFVLQK